MNSAEGSFMMNTLRSCVPRLRRFHRCPLRRWCVGLCRCHLPWSRLGKYGKDGKSRAIPGHSLTLASLGVFILWFGWFGFNPGSQLAASGQVNREAISHVFLTTNMAAVCGGLATMFLTWIKYGKPSFSLTLNGILAGLVGITAGCSRIGRGVCNHWSVLRYRSSVRCRVYR